MKTKNYYFLLLALFLVPFGIQAQIEVPPAVQPEMENESTALASKILLFNVTYGIQFPGGDMADRFGTSFDLGGGFEYMSPSNWIGGLEAQYLFGSEVKENVLATLVGANEIIYSDIGLTADIILKERGFHTAAYVGKLIPFNKEKNPRSGIRITIGAGLLQHKIRVQDDPQAFVGQIQGEYKKGYDRMTNGLAISQFIGYQYMAKDQLVNFFAGFDFVQAFTQSRRSFNFDTMMQDTEKRFDLLSGFRVGWTLPFYLGEPTEEFFY
jgi:hypothetical protein